MIRRKLQDLTLCISYNVNFLHDKAHGSKSFRKQYSISEEIGRGGFGIVYKAERIEDGAPVAVKFVEHRHVRDWTTTCKQLMPTEICLLEMCRGTPGVVRLIDWFANSKGFMIVMERPEEFMDLFDLISVYGCLDEKMARSIFVQIVNTVCSLYADHGVLHRDIKDENIIVNMRTGEVILVDFGAAALISKTDMKEFQGTRSYCPPEWFKRVVYMPLEATVWSLGIVLYVIVTGSLPFRNEIQICLGRLTIPKRISEDCAHLIRRCLAVTPERRADLIELRQHRWLCEPITIHSEPFKCVLDRELSKRLSGRRKVKRVASSGAMSSDDTEFLSDSQTDASIDVCERIRRASSADVTMDADNDMTPMAQRRVLGRSNIENDEKFRCFSSYDNVSVDTPTEMLHLVGYENIREGAQETNKFRSSVDTADQLSRDMSTSQYYSAHESLGFCADGPNPLAVGYRITEDESSYFDTDSLQDVSTLECNETPTTSKFVSQYPLESSCLPSDVNTNEVVFDNATFECGKNELEANDINEIMSHKSSEIDVTECSVSPSLSRHRPLTVQRWDVENANNALTSLGIFRIDSRKYSGRQPLAVKCSSAENRANCNFVPKVILS